MTFKWTDNCIEGPYRAKNKKIRRIFLATLTLFLVFALLAILYVRHVISAQDPDVYIVRKGDTLWDICKEIYGEMQDTREMVYRMMKLNNIKDPGKLKPGMKLLLPVIVD